MSVIMQITLVTGVRPNEQPGDLEAGEGAHVTKILTESSIQHEVEVIEEVLLFV